MGPTKVESAYKPPPKQVITQGGRLEFLWYFYYFYYFCERENPFFSHRVEYKQQKNAATAKYWRPRSIGNTPISHIASPNHTHLIRWSAQCYAAFLCRNENAKACRRNQRENPRMIHRVNTRMKMLMKNMARMPLSWMKNKVSFWESMRFIPWRWDNKNIIKI